MPMPAAVTIVKVQIPMATTRPDKSVCLVYDKHKRHMIEQHIPQKARDALRGDVRAFFEATFNDSAWSIHRRVPEQFW